MQFIVGGRCMTRDNEKHITNKRLGDFDAVSLYPSAQKRIFYPTGPAHTLTPEMIKYYNCHDNLFKITTE